MLQPATADVARYAVLRCAARVAMAANDEIEARRQLGAARTLFAGLGPADGHVADALLHQFSSDYLLANPAEALRRIGRALPEPVA